MLFAHEFETIKTWPVTFQHLGGGQEINAGTLDDIAVEMLDFHLDIKKILEQHYQKLLKFKIQLFRGPAGAAATFIPTFAPSDYAGEDLGGGSQHINVSAEDGSYSFSNIGGTPPGGFAPGNNTYWTMEWKEADPETEVHFESGQFLTPSTIYTPGTAVIDELFEIEIARLNYRQFLDKNVVRKGEDDPEKTNLVIEVDQVDGVDSSSEWIIGLKDGRVHGFVTSSTSSHEFEVGLKSFQVPAGLPYVVGLRLLLRARDDPTMTMSGIVERYNDDGHDKFRHARGQIACNLHGQFSDAISSKDSTIIRPHIFRNFPQGDPVPNMQDPDKWDDIGVWINPPGLSEFDRILGDPDEGPVPGAPYFFGPNSPVAWTNGGEGGSWEFGGFTEMAAGSTGLKVGYLTRNVSGGGGENISLPVANLEYVDP